MGAVIRFMVKDHNNSGISVYLDCYGCLGAMDVPYWEIHPSEDEDCERFLMNDIDGLLDGIKRSFEHQNPTPYVPDVPVTGKSEPAQNRFSAIDVVMHGDE
jgi:hypothetical protein